MLSKRLGHLADASSPGAALDRLASNVGRVAEYFKPGLSLSSDLLAANHSSTTTLRSSYGSNGYYAGIRTLVASPHHIDNSSSRGLADSDKSSGLKEQDLNDRRDEYSPHKRTVETQDCFLDEAQSMSIPKVYSYTGIPQHHSDPLHGSYRVLGLRDDVCFDRHGRLGIYGDITNSTLGNTWLSRAEIESKPTSEGPEPAFVDWTAVDWAAAQKRCYKDNSHRFIPPEDAKQAKASNRQIVPRQAIVLRTWTNYNYTSHVMMNLRALISEASLASGGEYDVHLLVHVKNNSALFWEDERLYARLRNESVPEEFRGLVTLWSEKQMELIYPGPFCNNTVNKSGMPIHGVYRSSHMPLQHFAQTHAQYEHFWNWEMDMRYIGHYYELYNQLGQWAKLQPRHGAWERSGKYYIEKLHETWAGFSRLVAQENVNMVTGPVNFPGSKAFGSHKKDQILGADSKEDADLITLSPLFDPNESGWYFDKDITGYDTDLPVPPRRVAIIAASRISRRLLQLMHIETVEYKRSMWTEMWAPSIALHYGLKAVYAPHPVYYDREWPLATANNIFNAGEKGSSGGNASVERTALARSTHTTPGLPFLVHFHNTAYDTSNPFYEARQCLGSRSKLQNLSSAANMDNATALQAERPNSTQPQDACVPLTIEENIEEFELTGLNLITVISGLVLAIFLVSLDSAIVATAVPYVTAEFKSTGDTAWYGSAYTLATCALQPIAGKLYVKFPIKTMFLAFIALFEIGSLVCATTPNAVGLIVGRAIAGAGAAGCTTGGFSIVAIAVRLPKRTTYISVLQSTFGIGIMLGPLLGGVLTERASWRWCFYINLPIGAITVLLLFFFFNPPKPDQNTTPARKMAAVDLIGLLLFAPATIMMLLALQWGGLEYAWVSTTIIGLFAGAVVLTCIFALWQVRKGDDAMIPPRLFTQRVVFFACLTELFAMGTVYIAIFYLPQWFQIVKGVTPIKSGVMYLPLSMSDVASALVVGILLPYVGLTNPFILAGTTLLTVGSGLLSTLTASSGLKYWVPYQILPGLGAGITLWMPYVAVQTVLKAEDIPVATALLQFFQSFGAALFLALGQTVFSSVFATALTSSNLPGLDVSAIVHAAPADLRQLVLKESLSQVLDAYNQGVTSTFYLGAGLAAAACFASFGIQWKSFKPKSD
ncbi:MFS general substrate transporter [Aureobasidium subglaciale]|nr:MFS general substrate transporter [Aureobasidium subglaciale]